jgi:hypothetical protein
MPCSKFSKIRGTFKKFHSSSNNFSPTNSTKDDLTRPSYQYPSLSSYSPNESFVQPLLKQEESFKQKDRSGTADFFSTSFSQNIDPSAPQISQIFYPKVNEDQSLLDLPPSNEVKYPPLHSEQSNFPINQPYILYPEYLFKRDSYSNKSQNEAPQNAYPNFSEEDSSYFLPQYSNE